MSNPESAEALHDVWEVRQAVAELPDDEQEIVRLQHFEGLSTPRSGNSCVWRWGP